MDYKELENFVETFKLPQSQFHFKPESIEGVDGDMVKLVGREASTNMTVNMNVTKHKLRQMVDQHPDHWAPILGDYFRKTGKIADE